MKRLFWLLLLGSLFEARTLATKSKLYNLCRIGQVFAALWNNALHVTALGPDESTSYLKLALIGYLDIVATCILCCSIPAIEVWVFSLHRLELLHVVLRQKSAITLTMVSWHKARRIWLQLVGVKWVVDILLFKLGWWYDSARWGRNKRFWKVLLLLSYRRWGWFGICLRVLRLRRLELGLVSAHKLRSFFLSFILNLSLVLFNLNALMVRCGEPLDKQIDASRCQILAI